MFKFSTDPHIAEDQMRAIIYYLVAFAYIDADFDPSEKDFIQEYVGLLVAQRADGAMEAGPARDDAVSRWTSHFHGVLDEIDLTIQGYFTESVSHGETTQQFVLAKLKLGCFELMKRFEEEGQRALLGTIEELIQADGVVHPSEVAFRDEIVRLVNAEVILDETEIEFVEAGEVIVDPVAQLTPRVLNHPFFKYEWDFARDPAAFERQSQEDMALVDRLMALFDEQRGGGKGRLAEAQDFSGFAPGSRFLDGFIHVAAPPPEQDYELLVLGDLHGCYSCLKAALLQADFFGKVHAHRDDPTGAPAMAAVFLGDYIDRGRFGLSGTLRTAMQLQVSMPQEVYLLRGNHEYYVELDGKVLAPVRPCEAMDSISRVAKPEVFVKYMKLFEAMPTMLAFGQTVFVHGGAPRTDTLQKKWASLETLNDWDLRFEMLWSDPSEADLVPLELQAESARFPFGRLQFQQFLARLGCTAMVRGHQMVKEGFAKHYDDPGALLLTVFSAGGADNDDLPADSSYRSVTPKALSIRRTGGVTTFTPFDIDYKRYNDPEYNAFFKQELGV
jgi:hypothetical protein